MVRCCSGRLVGIFFVTPPSGARIDLVARAGRGAPFSLSSTSPRAGLGAEAMAVVTVVGAAGAAGSSVKIWNVRPPPARSGLAAEVGTAPSLRCGASEPDDARRGSRSGMPLPANGLLASGFALSGLELNGFAASGLPAGLEASTPCFGLTRFSFGTSTPPTAPRAFGLSAAVLAAAAGRGASARRVAFAFEGDEERLEDVDDEEEEERERGGVSAYTAKMAPFFFVTGMLDEEVSR